MITRPEPGDLTGTIKDGCTGMPLADVAVLIAGKYATTDAEGRYRVRGLEPREQAYSIARKGYLTVEGSLAIIADRETKLDLAVLPNLTLQLDPSARLLDVLFVIDASRSMLGEQEQLARGFQRFIEPILDATSADVRIGVVTPDLGAGPYTFVETCRVSLGGKLQSARSGSDCVVSTDPWLSVSKGGTNVPAGAEDPSERAAAAFGCIARVGADGCGFEQPLEAMRLALDPKRGVNPGFLRAEAALAVIIVTDEDDCSAARTELFDTHDTSLGRSDFRCFARGTACDGVTPDEMLSTLGLLRNCRPAGNWLFAPDEYATFLRQLKQPGVPVYLAVIAAPAEPVIVRASNGIGPGGEPGADLSPSCSLTISAADRSSGFPAIRLKALVDQLSPLSFFGSICAEDYGPMLRTLGQQIASVARRVCEEHAGP